MKITFHASDHLPSDVAAIMVPGDQECSLMLNRNATVSDIAAALTTVVREWADEDWMYIGGVREPHLRAIN